MTNDPSWEPDGVTLQVRFYEGGGTYRVTGIPAATLPVLTVAVSNGTVIAGGAFTSIGGEVRSNFAILAP